MWWGPIRMRTAHPSRQHAKTQRCKSKGQRTSQRIVCTALKKRRFNASHPPCDDTILYLPCLAYRQPQPRPSHHTRTCTSAAEPRPPHRAEHPRCLFSAGSFISSNARRVIGCMQLSDEPWRSTNPAAARCSSFTRV
jgi:hypothetical protein